MEPQPTRSTPSAAACGKRKASALAGSAFHEAAPPDDDGGEPMAVAAEGGGDAGMQDFSGVDPNLEPELATALRVSMEEERVRQEAASKTDGDAAPVDGAAAGAGTASGLVDHVGLGASVASEAPRGNTTLAPVERATRLLEGSSSSADEVTQPMKALLLEMMGEHHRLDTLAALASHLLKHTCGRTLRMLRQVNHGTREHVAALWKARVRTASRDLIRVNEVTHHPLL